MHSHLKKYQEIVVRDGYVIISFRICIFLTNQNIWRYMKAIYFPSLLLEHCGSRLEWKLMHAQRGIFEITLQHPNIMAPLGQCLLHFSVELIIL